MGNDKIILVFVGTYLPGNKAGGPIRSVANLVELLGDEFSFKIITADHDFGVAAPYPEIESDQWCKVGKAEVYYASGKSLTFPRLIYLINSIHFDILYLNSFFCFNFTIKPLLLRYFKLIPDRPTILAPRGMFSQGALNQKRLKKQFYLFFVRAVGLYADIIWQASSKFEKVDIENVFCNAVMKRGAPLVAPDLVGGSTNETSYLPRTKTSGALNVVFLSRISPKKNLDGALLMLKGLKGDIVFNVYGPEEDRGYSRLCKDICKSLPVNIRVIFHGEVGHAQVHKVFSANHLFLFPTFGENFGHVILESLMAGCPVLLSDQTPWRGLEQLGVGWDIPLHAADKFQAALQACVQMNDDAFSSFSKRAFDFARDHLNDPMALQQNRELFNYAIAQRQRS